MKITANYSKQLLSIMITRHFQSVNKQNKIWNISNNNEINSNTGLRKVINQYSKTSLNYKL